MPTSRKSALSQDDLVFAIRSLPPHPTHDDLLFIAMLLSGFYGLHRLGELSFPDDVELRDDQKTIKAASVVISPSGYQYFLPGHKADRFFEGNTFPLSAELWLTSAGTVPTRSFFMRRLRILFNKSIAGQSMRAGGATSLAENGVAPSIIQATGRWSSDAFQLYIRKNPVLIQALIFGRSLQSMPAYTHIS
ncbi:hypothetical protein Hypma_002006 [Hypsizygus marmoreus]|uniref:Tyr recombinase domain-containing protein n=1 Tax=Hypsizygus marmoreus TaxID=39966 RepID=A0A369JCP3_HYPMA|nr:hypothetical protein Hypma_002006 [Hypsizygus marmoreus]